MTASDTRERLIAFLHATDRGAATAVAPVAVDDEGRDSVARAWAITDALRPLVWDANHLYVEAAGGASAPALARAADRALRPVCPQGGVVIASAVDGEALRDSFAAFGWCAVPHLLMVHRDPSRLTPSPAARPVSEEEAAPARRAVMLAEPWAADDVVEQILSRDALIARRARGISYGAERDGAVASCCVVLQRERIAQVDNVGTAPAARGRGLARSVVSLATARALREAELVFLCADPADWPRRLYERLGYDPIGLLHRFQPVLPGLAQG